MPILTSSTSPLIAGGKFFRRHMKLPLADLKLWSQQSSFEIDALGLVTLLGADEVNLAIGTLQQRQITEFLPLLAAFVIAGNRFTDEQPGFVLYNLSEGITSTQLNGWFTRWLMSQKVNNATTIFEWVPRGSQCRKVRILAPIIAFLCVAPLLVGTILMGDWYGVGNAAAIILSILVRIRLVSELRRARDFSAAPKFQNTSGHLKTLCVIRSDGKMVTIKAPSSVLNTFTKDCTVNRQGLYKQTRRIGWVALGGHMLILGMCTLVAQIYTVLLLVLSTWALSSDFDVDFKLKRQRYTVRHGDDFMADVTTMPFNDDWDVIQTNPVKMKDCDPNLWPMLQDRRGVAWARIIDDERKEAMMKRWNLFPLEENVAWWAEFSSFRKAYQTARYPDEKQLEVPIIETTEHRPISTTMPSTASIHSLLKPAPASLSPSASGTSTLDPSRSSSPGPTDNIPKSMV